MTQLDRLLQIGHTGQTPFNAFHFEQFANGRVLLDRDRLACHLPFVRGLSTLIVEMDALACVHESAFDADQSNIDVLRTRRDLLQCLQIV